MAPNLPPQWAQRFIVPSTFSRSGGSRTSLKRARRNKRKPPPNHEAGDSPRFHSTGSLAPCNLEGSSSLWIPVSIYIARLCSSPPLATFLRPFEGDTHL